MAKIDSAYDYYVSTYGNQKASRYDSHKKSDLRKIYNSIVKSNKESPLYKISNLEGAKRFAIDIKERTKVIQNVVSSLSDDYENLSNAFQKKVAVSADDSSVGVEYIGNGSEKNTTDYFEILVEDLAAPQMNTGNYLKDDAMSFTPGTYSFDLTTSTAAYEFQYNVNPGETNRDVLTKLGNLVNTSNLGIEADLLSNEKGESALSLVSKQTGLGEKESYLFSIQPTGTKNSMNAMDLLGIHNVTAEAHNSSFRLNGHSQSSLSNTFTINNAFELTLKKPTDAPVRIGFKTNADAVADNIQSLLDAYNGILRTAKTYSESGAGNNHKLLTDMGAASLNKKVALESIGLMVAEDGSVEVDREILSSALTPDRVEDTFSILTDFRDTIGKKANSAAIDPMHYVDKVVVEYKNPGHNFAAPYVSSIYSGLLLDNYI